MFFKQRVEKPTNTNWKRVFAWLPVQVVDGYVWLEFVWRRGITDFEYEYRRILIDK